MEESDNKGVPPYRFNAKELDEETGLYYYGARYLDPTSVGWLSVDPMWEKNIGASPYNYCHGNPITVVDPDGQDEWEVNQQGYFNRICENKEYDVIYSIECNGVRTGEVLFPYGTIEGMENTSITYEEQDFTLTYLIVNSESSAKQIFEFLVDPSSFYANEGTGVEWSLAIMSGENILSTSHDSWGDFSGMQAYKKRHKECSLLKHYHNHPNNDKFSSGEGGDISVVKLLKKWGMANDATIFSIYTPKDKTYNNYDENSVNELDQIDFIWQK